MLWRAVRRAVRDGQGRGPRRGDDRVHTDRGDLSAPLIVDALGWRRILATDDGYQPPDAPLSRGLEVHPEGGSDDLEIWIDRRYVPAGYGWSLPRRATSSGSASAPSTRASTSRTRPCCWPRTSSGRRSATRATGSRTSCAARPRAGSSSSATRPGHCLPLTAEGIRTAFYFGIALRARAARRRRGAAGPQQAALRDYAAFNDSHEWKFRWMLRVQKLVPRLPPRVQRAVIARDRPQALHRLVLRPLPADRPARVRRPRARAQPGTRALTPPPSAWPRRALRPRAAPAAAARAAAPARRRGGSRWPTPPERASRSRPRTRRRRRSRLRARTTRADRGQVARPGAPAATSCRPG